MFGFSFRISCTVTVIHFVLHPCGPLVRQGLHRIGLGVTALTLIGYVYIGEAFPLWMAFVNGGGLILGGLWMRRI
ncbi:hypothetical protein UNPF46_12005 [Bradyrhizobium sp. UNPF46]|nr:hypothetical protein UNPF46_12005 [Bradyrhizobium sp. UNPF46]